MTVDDEDVSKKSHWLGNGIDEEGHTSYVPGRTNASFPRYLQISDVMTSRSIPSRGTKYSFWRAAGGAAGWLVLLALPAIVENLGQRVFR